MRTILVLNSKGGAGKTTVATNLAAYYALAGQKVALVDYDQQASATDWLALRPAERAPIRGVEGWTSGARVPRDTELVVMDAPAATHGKHLNEMLRRAQSVVIPVIPSPPDLNAALRLHAELLVASQLVNDKVRVATIANRVREYSPTRLAVEDLLRSFKLPDGRRLPFVAYLRNTMNYARAFERGLSVFEIAPSLVAHDLELWKPLLRWLAGKRSIPE